MVHRCCQVETQQESMSGIADSSTGLVLRRWTHALVQPVLRSFISHASLITWQGECVPVSAGSLCLRVCQTVSEPRTMRLIVQRWLQQMCQASVCGDEVGPWRQSIQHHDVVLIREVCVTLHLCIVHVACLTLTALG
jgi:hypothetical protein